MNQVTMTVEGFRSLYPEFSNVTNEELATSFRLAPLYLDNSEMSVVIDLKKRELLLYLITAHICYLKYGNNKGQGGSGVVGRVSNASEGTVSVGTDVGSMSPNAAWYMQSQYGWEFWEATKVYRMGVWFSGADYP